VKRSGEKPKARRDAPTPPGERVAAQSTASARWQRGEWLLLAAILAVGFGLRAVYLAEIIQEPDFCFPAMDPQYNDYCARGMAFGAWTPPEGYPDPQVRTTPHGRPPGYPYFLAFVYRVCGPGYLAPRLIQMTLGLLNGVLMFFLARALFGSAVGLIATAFMVTYWVFIHFEGELTYPVVAVFALLLFMHGVLRWKHKPNLWRALIAGLLFGLFALFRPNGLLFGPVLVAWFWWVLRGRKDFARFMVSAAALTIGTILAIAPALVRNYVVAQDFVFLSSYGGVNLWIGNNANCDGVTPKIPELEEIAGLKDWTCFHYPLIVRGLGRTLGKEDLKFSEASSYFYGRAVDFIAHHPLKVLQLAGKKALVFWGPTETTNDKVLHWAKKKSRLLHWLPGFPVVLALFVVGVALFVGDWRERRTRDTPEGTADEPSRMAAAVMPLLFILAYFASVVPYFVAGRYRIPVIPFLLLFGAYGVWRISRLVAGRAYRRAGIWVGVGVATCCVGSIQFYTYTPDLAIWHHQRAKAYECSGDLDAAIAEVRKELDIDPAYADGYNFLGKLLEKQGRYDEATGAYQRAVELEPENYVGLNNLGFQRLRQGRTAEAMALYTKAFAINPRFGLLRNNLGNLLAEQGKVDEAIAHYTEALRLDPNDRYADYNLGNALAAQGRLDEAIAHYVRALAIDPRNPDIPNNLGLALAKQGKAEEAVRMYHKALAIDPAYANAHNNLAYELAGMDQTDEALTHYARALELDPEFPLAHNNLGKLLVKLGRADEGMAHFEKALAIDPKDELAHLNLADTLAGQGHLDEAIRHYLDALENDPANPDIPNNLANALVKKARFAEAVQYYESALAIDPDYVNAHCNLGTVYAGLGNVDKAVEHFTRALEISPDNALAREGLDKALRAKRQREEATGL